jgi:hypothetical protein
VIANSQTGLPSTDNDGLRVLLTHFDFSYDEAIPSLNL